MEAQEFENLADLRIRFAYRHANDYLIPYAIKPDYNLLFAEEPACWTVQLPVDIKTRSVGRRRARVFSREGSQLAAVEHETGLEILGALAAIAGLIQFSVWAYDRWKDVKPSVQPPHGPNEPALQMTQIEERFPDGRERVIRSLEVRGQLEPDNLGTVLQGFMPS